MPFAISLTPQAERDLERIGSRHLPFILEQLQRLAQSPVTLSRPSVSPPFPPNRQQFTFARPSPDDLLLRDNYVILFRFAADETRLIILDIGYHAAVVWPDEEYLLAALQKQSLLSVSSSYF